jgi:hypothetical protein
MRFFTFRISPSSANPCTRLGNWVTGNSSHGTTAVFAGRHTLHCVLRSSTCCAVTQYKLAKFIQLGIGHVILHVIHAPRANHEFQLAVFIKRMIHGGQQRERFFVARFTLDGRRIPICANQTPIEDFSGVEVSIPTLCYPLLPLDGLRPCILIPCSVPQNACDPS